jgi:hypothetical protein
MSRVRELETAQKNEAVPNSCGTQFPIHLLTTKWGEQTLIDNHLLTTY